MNASNRNCGLWKTISSILAVGVALGGAFAQAQPVIQSVRNAASNVSGSVTPQMIVSIMGQNLSTSTATFTGFPLTTTLGGTTVTFNGTKAPLFYASPTQINAQVPTGVGTVNPANVVVTTSAGSSAVFMVPTENSAVGIFTQNSTGCGQLSAFNVLADGRRTLNTPQNSLNPLTDWGLEIYLTGLGPKPSVVDGTASQADLLNPTPVIVMLKNKALDAAYAGPAPGAVGEDQINAMIAPSSRSLLAQGCKVPLSVSANIYSTSQYVNVSVHQGGGACVDPASDSFGIITWRKSVVSDATAPSSSDRVDAQFLGGPNVAFPAITTGGSYNVAGPLTPAPSFCAASYPASLGVGTVSASGFGSFITLDPHTNDGVVTYQADLPAGTITGGTYTVNSNGSTVGPFNVQADIPSPISITTDLKPGTTLTGNSLSLDWTGGDNRSVLAIQYQVRSLGKVIFSSLATASAAAGQLRSTLSAALQDVPAGDVEIVVTQQPPSAPSQFFSAPGLTLGGEQTWSYVFDFKGLKHQ